MNLINETVTHKVFGKGNIVDHNDSIVTVDFNDDIKRFVYPDAFSNFITLKNKEIADSFEKVMLEKIRKKEARDKELEEEREFQVAEQERRDKLKNHKIHESSQIVFWLDEEEQENIFTDWHVFTGNVQSGKSKGEPNRATRLRPNSAGILTARNSEQPEDERKILGLYMVTETFSGNLSDDGIIPAHKDFRIELSDQEAEKMLFWNYYINKNFPDRSTWNSGKYRYFDNVWTAQILKDIIALKTDEEQIQNVQKFLEYFCQANALDINNIPEADGALKQQ